MKLDLAPKFIRPIGDVNILWFQKSNSYVVLDGSLLQLLNIYLEADSKSEFIEQTNKLSSISASQAKDYFIEITRLLDSNQATITEPVPSLPKENKTLPDLCYNYSINSCEIQIYYSSEIVKDLIHPQFAHLAQDKVKYDTSNHKIVIYHQEKHLSLYYNTKCLGTFHQTQYHLLKGQLTMLILRLLTDTQENDWIGTLHASSIGNKNEAIMFVGASGQGKSTLSALMNSEGFDLITDDITPIKASNSNIYQFPSGISMKKGGYKALHALSKQPNKSFDYNLDPKKGPIKYVTPLNSFTGQHLPCSKVVVINYNESDINELKTIPIELALQSFLSDSWISSKPENVNIFLDWLAESTFYSLSYCDSNYGISIISSLFD